MSLFDLEVEIIALANLRIFFSVVYKMSEPEHASQYQTYSVTWPAHAVYNFQTCRY